MEVLVDAVRRVVGVELLGVELGVELEWGGKIGKEGLGEKGRD